MSSAPEPRFQSRAWEHLARPEGGGRFRLWRLGIVLLLVCGAILLLDRRAARNAPPGTSPVDATPRVRALAPSETFDPPQMARLAGPPLRLAWPGVGTGAVYRVRMVDESGAEIWTSDALEGTSVDLPEELRARLATGGRFGWRVAVTDASGGAERKMPFRELEVLP